MKKATTNTAAEKKYYVASDGTRFSKWEDCRDYQRELNDNRTR